MAESRLPITPWMAMLVAGAAVTGVAVIAPADAQATLVAVAGLTFLAFAFRRAARLPLDSRRAWLIVSLAGTLMLLGAIARAVYGQIIGVEEPLPSPADVLSVVGYALVVVGQVVLIRRRSPIADFDAWIDATVAAAAIGLTLWATLLSPYFTHSVVPTDERALNALYFMLTLTLVLTTVRLAIGAGHRTISYYLFAACVLVFFATDFFGTLAYAHGGSKKIITLLTPPVYALFCAALYHPSVVRLTDPPIEAEPQLSLRRLFMLSAALMMPPLVIVYELSRNDAIDRVMVVSSALVMAVLVLLRMTRLVRARERMVEQEQALRMAGEHLVAATTQDEVSVQAMRACRQLLEGDTPELVRLLSQEELESAEWREVPDDPLVHLSTFVSRGTVEGGLVVRTKTPLPRARKNALNDLAREVALARRGVADAENLHRLKSERRFRALFENSSDVISILGEDQLVVFCSPAVERILGRPAESLVGQPPFVLVHPDDRRRARALLEAPTPATAIPERLEIRMLHADESYRWFEVLTRDLGVDSDIGGIVVNAREITDRKGAESRLATSEARFRALVQNSSDVVAVIDEQGFFTYMSPAVMGMLGYRADELVGTSVLALLPSDQVERASLYGSLVASTDTFAQSSIEVHLSDATGQSHTVDVTVTDLRKEPAVRGVVLNARDVTLRKELEHDLRHQALHDTLTGLGNRAMFTTRVTDALNRGDDRPDSLAVLFVDLDDFKTVNDSLGHAVGDQLLVAVAERLLGCLRVSDTAARLGGDEFAVLLEHSYGEAEIIGVAQRMLDSMQSPISIQGRDIEIGASIGIAIKSSCSVTSEVLLRNADMAMYLAKDQGKARYEIFEEGMHASVFERLETKAALRKGIEEGELVLYYQPILSMRSTVITGVEALVRWRHPEKGLLGPGAFVSLAEETGLIVPLGSWVLNEAVRQLAVWRDRELVGRDFTMSVNLSVRQLHEANVVTEIAEVLARHATPAENLIVEITESLLVDDSHSAQERLQELRVLGVSLAVDDFGTGYSGLGYIQRFPIDVLKIDRSFVDGLEAPEADASVVRAIINLAGQIGARTVAEGIECSEQLAVLKDLGCDSAQGFYFSRPIPPAEFAALVTGTGDQGPVLRVARLEKLPTDH